MKNFYKQFFAKRDDLLPGIQHLESEVELQYVLREMSPSPTPIIFFSALDIPNLGFSEYGDHNHESEWLVMEKGREITVEEVPQRKGGILYDISLKENPTAFAFTPAGQFGEKTIIQGDVESSIYNKDSFDNCKWFWSKLRKGFKKTNGYYVGPEAYRLLEQGWRLTVATQCPPKYDIRI